MPTVTWTDAARTQLLLIIIHLGKPPKWDKVAQLLNNGCTGEAARQQFKMLKARAKKEFGDVPADRDEDKQFAKPKNTAKDTFGNAGASDAGADDKPKTPAKRRGKMVDGESATKSTSKRKASKPAHEANDEDDEESPVKKVKSEATKDDDEDGF